MSFPKLLTTSVVRGSQQGDSHGGIYLVDLESKTAKQVIDWDHCNIDFTGRGADRGLRGIAFYNGLIYIAASDEIFIFDQSFTILDSIKSPYLKHCHEIVIWQDMLYLTSTGFDSILIYDLVNQCFKTSIYLVSQSKSMRVLHFNPNSNKGPNPSNGLHINSVFVDNSGIYVAGRKMPLLLGIKGSQFGGVTPIPLGTHNAQPWQDGVIFNDTESNQLLINTPQYQTRLEVPKFNAQEVLGLQKYQSELARPRFARGLCILSPHLVAIGCSPSTVAIYDLKQNTQITQVSISKDVRNAIHGLAVWPY